ncbi:MAG: sulfotransferase family protein [Pseudomonadota bacterium]
MIHRNLPDTFPNFLGIGASKCGTSSLYAYMRQHPDIFLSHVKETHFFTYDEIYSLGPAAFANEYYRGASGHRAIGDITPTYFVQPDIVIPRIKAVYGAKLPKLLLILRNPVDRAWSHYLHKVRSGEESESFESALLLEQERLTSDPLGWWGYQTESLYAVFLAKWLDAFPREQFLFLLTEELSSDPAAVLRRVFAFLGVDAECAIRDYGRKNIAGSVRSQAVLSLLAKPSPLKSLVKRLLPLAHRQKLKTRIIELNTAPGGWASRMSSEQRVLLMDRLRPGVRELERLTGLDLSVWSL